MPKVDIVITNDDGKQAVLSASFDFQFPAPSLDGVSPSVGSVAGGETVTLAGSGFRPGCSVTFGGRQATVQSVTPSEVVVVTPSML
jgi:hypothetical protein